MAKHRYLQVGFWQDHFVLSLTPEEKYFYVYLMTNTKTTQCGIYQLHKKIIEMETGYNRETVEKLLKRFVDYGKILYDNETSEIMLINWLKYNFINSSKVITCIKTELEQVRTSEFLQEFNRVCIRYGYPIDTVCILQGEKEKLKTKKEKEKEKLKIETNKEKLIEEIESNEVETKSNDDIDFDSILISWNDLPSPIKPIRSITQRRKDKIIARVRSLKLTNNEILSAINNIKNSEFCRGIGSKGWIIDFEWLFEDDTRFVKVLEGKYNKGGYGPNGDGSNSNKQGNDSKLQEDGIGL